MLKTERLVHKKRKSVGRWAGLLLLSVFLLSSCGHSQTDQDHLKADGGADDSVEFLENDFFVTHFMDMDDLIPILGSVVSANQVNVSTKLSGILAKTFFQEGDFVQKGALLAELDKNPLLYQRDQSKSQYDIGLSQLHIAQKDLFYADKLYKKGFVSDMSFDSTRATLEQKKAQLNLYEANYKEALDNLKHAKLYTPIRGYIAQKFVNTGQSVTAGQQLFWIVDLENLEARVSIPAEKISDVRVGTTACLLVGDQKIFLTTAISRISPQASSDSHTFSAFMPLPSKKHNLRVGLFVKGFMILGVRRHVIAVPDVAVHGESGSAFVYLVREGKIVKQPVQLGMVDQIHGYVEVLSGLQADQKIVRKDFGLLAQGLNVKIVAQK